MGEVQNWLRKILTVSRRLSSFIALVFQVFRNAKVLDLKVWCLEKGWGEGVEDEEGF